MIETQNSSMKDNLRDNRISHMESFRRYYGFLTGNEGIIKRSYRSRSSAVAQFVADRYLLRERWFLDQPRVNLFEAHFAAYYLVKSISELHFSMQNSAVDVIKSIPLLSTVTRIFDRWDCYNAEVVQEYKDSAKEQEREINKLAEKQPGGELNGIMPIMRAIYYDHDGYMSMDHLIEFGITTGDTEQIIMQKIQNRAEKIRMITGRPGFLQNAANWLSNVYLQNKNSPVLRDRQMKDTISSLILTPKN